MTNIVPLWGRFVFVAVLAFAFYVLGIAKGEQKAGQRHIDYVQAQAQKSIRIAKRQQEIVVKTEIKVRDRVHVIYKQGEEIEKLVPIYITSADDQRFAVSNGWVRLYDAAFSGDSPGPATEFDARPSEIPISAIAEVTAHNATSCRQWREQALAWREYYQGIRNASQ